MRAADSAVGHVMRAASDEVITHIAEATARERTIVLQAAAAQAASQESAISTAMAAALRSSGEAHLMLANSSERSIAIDRAARRIDGANRGTDQQPSASEIVRAGSQRARLNRKGGGSGRDLLSSQSSAEAKGVQQLVAAGVRSDSVSQAVSSVGLPSSFASGSTLNGHLPVQSVDAASCQ